MSENPNENLFTIVYNLLNLKLPQSWYIDYEVENDPECKIEIFGPYGLMGYPLLARIQFDVEKVVLNYHFYDANPRQKQIIEEILRSQLISVPIHEF